MRRTAQLLLLSGEGGLLVGRTMRVARTTLHCIITDIEHAIAMSGRSPDAKCRYAYEFLLGNDRTEFGNRPYTRRNVVVKLNPVK